ncbi:unnamed protein product [Polarella glacialis]|uniref:Uncharacterized protein n=1 Tax=Polarella glacialis TaxID=89957 RepID=A0A813HD54_POLGL|nr:unnamed protein product [Polarella glacialis]
MTCFVPWIICWVAYSILHWSYPIDSRRIKQEKQEELEEELRLQKLELEDVSVSKKSEPTTLSSRSGRRCNSPEVQGQEEEETEEGEPSSRIIVVLEASLEREEEQVITI